MPLDGGDFDRTAQRGQTVGEDSVMAECHRYPLRVQQSKLDGWWFIFVDEVPELGVLGPNYDDLLDRLKIVAANLFRARGETVTDIKIAPSERPALQVFH
jgi:predicted RNase H-like HicB family nuclease